MSVRTRMLTLFKRFSADERGVYAISFVMLAGFLLGMASLGLDGARFVSERARLSDAMEQAALALTAEDNGEGAARNYSLAKDYFRAYMRRETDVFTPKVVVKRGSSANNDNLSYVEYRVSGQTLQESWFSSSLFPGFDKEVIVGDNGAARKYRSNMDVIFVTDFSGSMNDPFDGSTKLDELKRIVLQLSGELFSYNINNKVGFIPFSWGGKEGGYCDFPFVANGPYPNDTLNMDNVQDLEAIVNVPATIAAIPRRVNDIRIPLDHIDDVQTCLIASYSWKVPLTSSMSAVRQIKNMTAKGGTLVSSGVLLGVPYLAAGTASRKVMVIVSDGTDNPDRIKLTPRLLNAGMCDKIRRVISTDESVGKIAFIGIKYAPTVDWKQCVGEKNFYLPQNIKQLEDDLRRAVFEEVGHNILKD